MKLEQDTYDIDGYNCRYFIFIIQVTVSKTSRPVADTIKLFSLISILAVELECLLLIEQNL